MQWIDWSSLLHIDYEITDWDRSEICTCALWDNAN